MSDPSDECRLDTMSQWTARTARVLAAFPSWAAEVRCLDLTEEVGEPSSTRSTWMSSTACNSLHWQSDGPLADTSAKVNS
jgi:hypothetical protein